MISKARPILIWEAMGAGFVILIGSALHFAFEWSGNFEPLAIFAAVNESIWEHLKLAFWPGFFWALMQLTVLGSLRNRILPVKGIALLITSILIVTVFLSYTAILQRNYLVLDIGTFVLAVIIGSAVSNHLLVRSRFPIVAQVLGWVLLISQLIAFSTFTYYPPDLSIFVDPRSKLSGLQ